jgi:hypothetical protein
MKITKIATLAAAVLLTAGVSGMAQTAHVWNDPQGWWGNHFSYSPNTTDKYTANEFSLDTFASYLAGENKLTDVFDTNIRHGKWGGGLGLNYFITRELGVGVDANIPDNDGNFIDSVSGSAIVRIPLGNSGLAPYILAGGGRQTDPAWEWTGHLGAGLEYRFNTTTGVFLDGRYVWADKTSDTVLLRSGIRFVF